MPNPLAQDEKLSETLDASGGLQQFRSVAQRPKTVRDDPFGRPPPTPVPAAPQPAPVSPTVEAPLKDSRSAARPTTKPPEPPARDEPAPDVAEGSEFTENVTVPLSRALRDRSEELAKSLNRNRSIRKSRITRNSIIRVALECFLDDFSPESGQAVNSEDELLQAARSARRRPRPSHR